VFQDRKWLGNPRLGSFVVYIDRKRAGVAAVGGELASGVAKGRDEVRIRQWWYRSQTIEVTIEGDEVLRLRGDIPRSMGFMRRMVQATFRRSSPLVLEGTKRAGTAPYIDTSLGSTARLLVRNSFGRAGGSGLT